ncbi:hypothetical protein HPB49_006667 [Dermacentor silvarum]|uniref:Uncharacterized protein n=1 Tax=Dermacentor silvarum TaxID=543639 RepID=A0ACB8C7V3_DERSI|nr:hypothetical protein HPB49_006667 [Dermacentor silvarum]
MSLASNPDEASVALIGGFIVRAASERILCGNSIALLQAPKHNNPLHGLIARQDRRGLYCPSEDLVIVLRGLRRFSDTVLYNRSSIAQPLEDCVERSVRALMELPVLRCEKCGEKQRKMFLHLIAKKFMQPIFTNYAIGLTDRNKATKLLERKPLSRKVLKL